MNRVMVSRKSWFLLMLGIWLLLSAGVAAWAQGPGAKPGQEQAEKWVTMGRDAFDLLNADRSWQQKPFELKTFGPMSDVVITRMPLAELEGVSRQIHHGLHRCGGFIAFDTYDEALKTIQAAKTNIYKALLVDFQIQNQSLVNPAIAEVQGANILSTIQHLSTQYTNRYYQNSSGRQAALWIRDQWQQLSSARSDVSVELFNHSNYTQPSVILTFQGTTNASEVVVLGGHLDSINGAGGNTNPNTQAPGADDNASGIAALTEAIRVLISRGITPQRTVKFMAYAAEEAGFWAPAILPRSTRARAPTWWRFCSWI